VTKFADHVRWNALDHPHVAASHWLTTLALRDGCCLAVRCKDGLARSTEFFGRLMSKRGVVRRANSSAEKIQKLFNILAVAFDQGTLNSKSPAKFLFPNYGDAQGAQYTMRSQRLNEVPCRVGLARRICEAISASLVRIQPRV